MSTPSRGILGAIERIGNRLPDPVTLFLLGALLVLVLSQLGATLEWTAINPTNGDVVEVKVVERPHHSERHASFGCF